MTITLIFIMIVTARLTRVLWETRSEGCTRFSRRLRRRRTYTYYMACAVCSIIIMFAYTALLCCSLDYIIFLIQIKQGFRVHCRNAMCAKFRNFQIFNVTLNCDVCTNLMYPLGNKRAFRNACDSFYRVFSNAIICIALKK